MAERAGVHESTVSRAVNGKYIQCPQGVYELKYFFSGGSSFSSDSGEAGFRHFGGAEVYDRSAGRKRGQRFSDEPDPADCGGDSHQGNLRSPGESIAKYREELGIPSSSDRRREKVK